MTVRQAERVAPAGAAVLRVASMSNDQNLWMGLGEVT